MKKPISIFLLVCLLTVQTPFMASPTAGAQNVVLPKPGTIVHLSQPMNPPILKGIKVDPNNPFRFEFILDKGDQWSVVSDQLKEESSRLIKYFLASITTPETDLWVNLSPYEKDRVVPESFGQTEMGRDLLAQDYLLKQVTASLIYPEDELGRKFWKRIYEEAQAKYGTTNIPVNTFNKVWIVPEKAVVYENSMKNEPLHDEGGHTAYVVESRLKVMLEVDYLALEKNIVGAGPRPARSLSPGAGLEPARTDVNQLGSQIVREIIIPALTREVNEGTNFAQLRQVYNSLILATWYKKKIKDSILAKVYADQNKVTGIGIHDDVLDVESIYQQYLTAFKKGVFNYIKDDPTSISTTEAGIPRKYFSGGFTALNLNQAMTTTTNPGLLSDHAMKISVMVQQTHTFPIAQVQRDQAMKAEGYLMERLFNDVFDHPNDFQLHGTRVNQYPWEFTPTAPMIHTARRVLKAIANPYSKLFKIRFIEKEKFSKVEELDWDTLDRSPEEDFYYPEVTKELGPLFQNRLMQLAHDLVENKEPALWGDNRYVGILDMRHAGSANLYDLDLSVDLSEIRKRVEYYLSITPHIANYKKGWKGWADRARTEELVRQYRENVVQVLIQVAIVNIWLERLLEVGERFKLDNDKEERNPGVLLLVEERARGVFGFSNTEVLTREMIKKSYRILLRPIFPDAFRREAEKEAERRGLTDQEEKTAFIGSYIEGKIGPQFRELQEAYELLLHQYPDPVMEANDAAMTTTNPSPLSDQVRKISIEVVQSGKPTKTADGTDRAMTEELARIAKQGDEGVFLSADYVRLAYWHWASRYHPELLPYVTSAQHLGIQEQTIELIGQFNDHLNIRPLMTTADSLAAVEGQRARSQTLIVTTKDKFWALDMTDLEYTDTTIKARSIDPVTGNVGEMIRIRLDPGVRMTFKFLPKEDRAMKAEKNSVMEEIGSTIKDFAMKTITKGGIDFTTNKTPLEVQNAGQGINFELDPAMLRQLQNAPGFVPVIINIEPMPDLRGFLGISEGKLTDNNLIRR